MKTQLLFLVIIIIVFFQFNLYIYTILQKACMSCLYGSEDKDTLSLKYFIKAIYNVCLCLSIYCDLNTLGALECTLQNTSLTPLQLPECLIHSIYNIYMLIKQQVGINLQNCNTVTQTIDILSLSIPLKTKLVCFAGKEGGKCVFSGYIQY